MDGRVPAIAGQMLLIERELRQLGWWSAQQPDARRLASTAPFCVDTLTFAEWLQWVFLPRMKSIVEAGAAVPAACAIRSMAEVAWQAEGAKVSVLLAALGEFDRLIAGGPAG